MTDTPWWHENDGTPPSSGADALGSAAAEAARLFEVLRDRMMTDPNTLRAGMKMMEALTLLRGSGGHPVQPGDAPECAYCPVCQAISHARDLNPDVVEKLTTAAMEFADTVRQVVAPDGVDDDGAVRHVPLDDDEDLVDESGSGAEVVDEPPTGQSGSRKVEIDDDFLGWPGDTD